MSKKSLLLNAHVDIYLNNKLFFLAISSVIYEMVSSPKIFEVPSKKKL